MEALNKDHFRDIDGWLWPAKDQNCHRAVFDLTGIEKVLPLVGGNSVCVQAGGNCGVWPKELSRHFATVYTFEPDWANFQCLVRNCDERNIVKMQAALGVPRGPIRLLGRDENCGAHYVGGHGVIPVISVDSLYLTACDLIYLDIEGYEPLALQGAEQTIEKYRPVIALENKGHTDRYGVSQAGLEQLMQRFGYARIGTYKRDVFYHWVGK